MKMSPISENNFVSIELLETSISSSSVAIDAAKFSQIGSMFLIYESINSIGVQLGWLGKQKKNKEEYEQTRNDKVFL